MVLEVYFDAEYATYYYFNKILNAGVLLVAVFYIVVLLLLLKVKDLNTSPTGAPLNNDVNATVLPFCLGGRHPCQTLRLRPQMLLSSSAWRCRRQDSDSFIPQAQLYH